MEPRSVRYSQSTLTELMIPAYANFGGKIHGGILLSLIDKVAYTCASRHAGAYCVTVSVDGVDFLQPVEVGDLVSLHASVNYVGRTSLVIGIRVIAENVRNRTERHTNTSYVTMVAKGDDDKPTVVPELLLENEEDARRFLEAIKRRELRERYKDAFDNAITRLDVQHNLDQLTGHRCVVGWKHDSD
ncbi:acyl-CoA thioesterase [Dyadobacter aurulentus]|uniref:acyl-CoA thioesterase n=1 Tax=Dyadobacter sp. UC 10 TaxID=2605428 RepID=UPI0011F2A108|nr:acyl-CoA thioesterase [Dyadobacter sp. UC 10]KAA0991119.1 acyl-CoA thioesterase [Dyadobacter sp. UC 10]